MDKLVLSDKQRKFIRESIAKINIAHGAVRSGKTFASLLRFVELVINCPDNDIVIVGNTFSAIVENAVKPIKDQLFRGYCTWLPGNHKLIIGNKEIRVLGAHDEGAVRAIQGNTISLAYVDEMTTIPWSFMDMLITRLSNPWSTLIGTCNPDSPLHPLKERIIDAHDGKYSYALAFDLNDNPHLEPEYRLMLESRFSGLFYKRYVQGLWVMAEGAIFDSFDKQYHVVARAPTAPDSYLLGVDYGTSNPFAAVLVGYRANHTPRFWVEKEYYWDSKKTGRQKMNSEYADDLELHFGQYPIKRIYIDPSAEAFEVEMKHRRMAPVMEANNDVLPGIHFVGNQFANHQLKVLSCCPNTIREIEMYVWDTKACLRGEEEPLKQNDHCPDALRYALYTHFGKLGDVDKGGMGQTDPRTLGGGRPRFR